MLIGSVGKKAYMNILGDGTFTDRGIGKNNPTVNSVPLVADQYGRTNRAGEWNNAADYLDWASSVGNAIASALNSGATFIGNFKFDAMSSGAFYRVFGQYNSSGVVGFLYAIWDNTIENGYWFGATGSSFTSDGYADTSWNLYGIRTKDNTSNLLIDFIKNGVFQSTTGIKAGTTSPHPLRIGARPSTNQSFLGKANNIRFYDVFIKDGLLKIINSQKGRLRH